MSTAINRERFSKAYLGCHGTSTTWDGLQADPKSERRGKL